MTVSKPSCMKCSRWLTCTEPQKGPRYSCQNFRRMKEVGNVSEFSLINLFPGQQERDELEEAELRAQKTRKSTGSSGKVGDLAQEGNRKAKRLLKSIDKAEAPDFEVDDPGGNFIYQAMKDAYDPETNTVRDLKLDDRDLPRSDNYWDFSTRISGKSLKPPFARQLWIAAHLFGEYCPHCAKPKWYESIEDIPVDMDPADLAKRMRLLKSGVCPNCGSTKANMVLNGELRDINQLAMCVGQRGGKSAFNSTLGANVLHRMLKAPRMSTICRGIQDFTPLTFTFVGLTAGRAIRLLWNPFVEIVKANDWFKNYFTMLDDYGKQHGVEYYKNNVLFMRFFNKNIDLYPMGPVKRTLRGDTRVLAAIDELGWFPLTKASDDDDDSPDEEDDGREHANADEVFASLDNSLMTVRTEVYELYKRGISHIPTGYLLNLSSPQSQRDKIMRLIRESYDPEALSLGVQLPTWGISPLYQRNHPVIVAAYRKNPVKAERDFGANPPALNSSLFAESTLTKLFADRPATHTLFSSLGAEFDEEQDGDVIHRTLGILHKFKVPDSIPPGVLALDAGLSGNSFALSAGHLDDTILRYHAAMELIPRKKTHIDFPGMYKSVIKPLIEDLNIKVLAADRWNSITTLQQAKNDFPDLRCIQVSLNARDFSAFISAIENAELEFPELEKAIAEIKETKNYRKEMVGTPIAHLFLQMMTVKLHKGVLTKGDGFTDDIFRACAVAHAAAFDKKSQEHLSKYRHIGSAREGVTMGAVFSASRRRWY